MIVLKSPSIHPSLPVSCSGPPPAGGAAVLRPAQPEAHLPVRGAGVRRLPAEELLLHPGQQRYRLTLRQPRGVLGGCGSDPPGVLCADGSVRWRSFSPARLLVLGGIVTSVFLLSFGPFVVMVRPVCPDQNQNFVVVVLQLLCVPGPAAAGSDPALPLQTRPLPRLLGPQRLGPVQRSGQSSGAAR